MLLSKEKIIKSKINTDKVIDDQYDSLDLQKNISKIKKIANNLKKLLNTK